MTKYRVKKGKGKRFAIIILIVLVLIAAGLFIFVEHTSHDSHKDESIKKNEQNTDDANEKSEKTNLPENERAETAAKKLSGQTFGLIAMHPIDLEKGLSAYLGRLLDDSFDDIACAENRNSSGEKDDESDSSGIFSISVKTDCDEDTPGEYDADVTITDQSGKKETVPVTFNVADLDEVNRTKADFDFLTETGFIGKTRKGLSKIEGILIANKTFSVPNGYGRELSKDAFEAYEKMEINASEDDARLWIRSDYRPFKDQKLVYKGYVKKNGQKSADRYSARPGHSEHQTGLAIDVNSLKQSFADTPAGKWLDKNCHKFGYVIRYPKGKIKESMYIAEPWHLRYVGKTLSKKLYNKGDWITLEEYFGIDSSYR